MANFSIDHSGGNSPVGQVGQTGSLRPGDFQGLSIDHGGGSSQIGETNRFGRGITLRDILGQAGPRGSRLAGGGFLVVAKPMINWLEKRKAERAALARRDWTGRNPRMIAGQNAVDKGLLRTPELGVIKGGPHTGGRLPDDFVDRNMKDRGLPGQFFAPGSRYGPNWNKMTSPVERQTIRDMLAAKNRVYQSTGEGNSEIRPGQIPVGLRHVFANAAAQNKAFNRGLNRALAGKKLNARQKLAVGAAWNAAIKKGSSNALTQAIFGGNTNAKYGTKEQKATLAALANAGRGASRVASGASRVTRNAQGRMVIKRVGVRFRPKAIAARRAARRR